LEANYTDTDREYILSLPEYTSRHIDGYNILFSHHLYPDFTGSSTRLLPDNELILSHLLFMKENNYDLSFFGHNHVEGLCLLRDNKLSLEKIINAKQKPGIISVGVPFIANGKNNPGIARFDSISGIIKSKSLYPFISRVKIY